MIHFEEQSRLGLLKTIKSEVEEEEESIIVDGGSKGKGSQWGVKHNNYYQSETLSSDGATNTYQFQHLKNVQKQ